MTYAELKALTPDIPEARSPVCLATGSATVQLRAAIARLNTDGWQHRWKCGECNGWHSYLCPAHQAIKAMKAALVEIESPN